MPFFGRQTVLADLRLHKSQAGLVTTATLGRLGTTSVGYSNACLWPTDERTALGEGGMPIESGMVTVWRTGEADAPRADDTWTIGGVSYLVTSVTKRHYHHESSGYAIYDCRVSRTGPR